MRKNTIIRRPVITEKSLDQTKSNRYTFEVALHATKAQIKAAVKTVFGVDVTDITTARSAGKSHRTGRRRLSVTNPDTKKAMVAVKKGQTIKIFETTG